MNIQSIKEKLIKELGLAKEAVSEKNSKISLLAESALKQVSGGEVVVWAKWGKAWG